MGVQDYDMSMEAETVQIDLKNQWEKITNILWPL